MAEETESGGHGDEETLTDKEETEESEALGEGLYLLWVADEELGDLGEEELHHESEEEEHESHE